MPVDLSYRGIFVDIFIAPIAGVYLILLAYRLLAASCLPRLRKKRFYTLLYLFLLFLYSFLFRFPQSTFVERVIFVLCLTAHSYVIGMVEMARNWKWVAVFTSFVIETLMLPFLFFVVFMVALMLDGVD